MITETVSWIELAWVSFSIICLVANSGVFMFFVARLDAVSSGLMNPVTDVWIEEQLGVARVVRHGIKVFIQIPALAAGIYQMTQPPANPHVPVTPGSIFTLGAIMFIQFGLAGIATYEVWSILRIRRYAVRRALLQRRLANLREPGVD